MGTRQALCAKVERAKSSDRETGIATHYCVAYYSCLEMSSATGNRRAARWRRHVKLIAVEFPARIMSPTKPSKKRILIEYFQSHAGKRIGAADLRAAREELHRQLGPEDKTSLGYIASVLREAGYTVEYEDQYSDPVMPEPYATQLKGILEFHDLASAEHSLTKLDEILHGYSAASDRTGVRMVYALVRKGKLRAQSIAANPRVQTRKRLEKNEIANWFRIWLESPDIFTDWLELRKSSEEFRRTCR